MARGYRELLERARGAVRRLGLDELRALVVAGAEAIDAAPTLIDVREAAEYESGHLPGATHVPRSLLEMSIERAVPDKSTPLVLYCAAGSRSLLAALSLQELGYAR